jgi:cytochrome b subunit of formate dehydrogenase
MIEPRYGTVGRYTPAARVNHWLNVMLLILLALSGMSLFHPVLLFYERSVRRRHLNAHPASLAGARSIGELHSAVPALLAI